MFACVCLSVYVQRLVHGWIVSGKQMKSGPRCVFYSCLFVTACKGRYKNTVLCPVSVSPDTRDLPRYRTHWARSLMTDDQNRGVMCVCGWGACLRIRDIVWLFFKKKRNPKSAKSGDKRILQPHYEPYSRVLMYTTYTYLIVRCYHNLQYAITILLIFACAPNVHITCSVGCSHIAFPLV